MAGLPSSRIIFRDVNVVDVERGLVMLHENVIVDGNRIAAVGGPPSELPGAQIVEASGKYMVPGFFDSHVHVAFNGFLNIESDYRKTLKQYLMFGVTQVVDFFTVGGRFPGSSPETIRDDVNAGRVLGPYFLTSYGCLNAPGGFCSCSVGAAAAEIVTKEDVQRELDRIDAIRPDFIKMVYDDVFGTVANLTPELLGCLIEEVHRRGYRAAVHIATLADAHTAVDHGADILGHGIVDLVPPLFLREMARKRVVMIPTLASYEARSLPRWRISLPAASPAESVYAYQRETCSIYERKNQIALYQTAFEHAARNTAPMFEAGVRLAAGSDSGTWYTFPGEALHRELAIYCEHGLSPLTALRLATIDAARAFNLEDRFGSVKAGKVANLVLLAANPLSEIANTRAIETVMLNGNLLDVERLRLEVTLPNEVVPPPVSEEICSPHHLRQHRARATAMGQ